MTELARPVCSDGPIWDIWLSAFHAPSLAVADELGLFSTLAEGPATPDEFVAKLRVETRACEALLGLMASLRFLVQLDGRFHLTDVARTYLLPSSAFYWGGFLKRIRDIPLDCNKLIASLRRGTAAREARVSGQLWQATPPPPEALHSFTHAMHAHSFALAMRVIADFELAGVTSLLDVAGGSGSYSIAALLHYRDLRCTLLDLPVVCEIAADYASRHLVAERMAFVPSNMFADPWPGGHERVFFSDIFHDWDDEQCRWLAKRAFESLRPGGRVMVHEMVLDDTKASPLAATSYSMVMVFVTEGRQRSAAELSSILAAAGFVDVTATMTSSGYALFTATKP